MAVSKVGDALMLENNTVFQVMEIVEYEGNNYLYAFEAPEDITEMIDPKDMKLAFLKETIDIENEEVYVEQVKDQELIKILAELVLEELG